MTSQSTVSGDPKYRAVLDHGFVGLKDHMGGDAAILEAARTSYGQGTRMVSSDRTLLRYLMRHRHTTPFEMCEVKFHVRAPVFVLRQWHRHRTASINEESARYSEMTDDVYLPAREVIQPQSTDNKQGRVGEISTRNADGVVWMMDAAYETSRRSYAVLLGDRTGDDPERPGMEVIWDAFAESDGLFDNEFDGIARELARCVMPLGAYSEMYWKTNLRNLFHFLSLRADPHAQYEIRAFADAMIDLTRPLFPLAFEAFDDYVLDAASLSRMERDLLKLLLADARQRLDAMVADAGGDKSFAALHDLSNRELGEFRKKLDI